jgi:hypothetical protein
MGLFAPVPEKEVEAALATFKADSDSSEAEFREALEKHLFNSDLKVSPKREAGVSGLGTRVDLYFEYRGVDFLISIKKSLSEQKTKILLGEALVLATGWAPRPLCDRVFLYIVVFGDLDSKVAGHLEPLLTGLHVLCKVADRFAADILFFEEHADGGKCAKQRAD